MSASWSAKRYALLTETVKTLITKGVDVNARTKAGESAVSVARQRGQTPVVDLLVKSGAVGTTAPREPVSTSAPVAKILKAHGISPAAPLVAHVSGRALGRDCRRGLLHDRGVDRPGASHVLHAVCHRVGVAACASRRVDSASRRRLRPPGRAHADRRRRDSPGPSCPDLRPRYEVEWGLPPDAGRRTRTRSASFARSKRNASIVWCSSERPTCDGRSRNSRFTITGSEITRASRIG